MATIFDMYTFLGIGGGLILGVILVIVYKVVKERKEEDYDEIDRVVQEKERLLGLEKTHSTKRVEPEDSPKPPSNKELLDLWDDLGESDDKKDDWASDVPEDKNDGFVDIKEHLAEEVGQIIEEEQTETDQPEKDAE